jgi:hypothetical protein
MKAFHKFIGYDLRGPQGHLQDQLGDSRAHLGVVRVFARAQIVRGVFCVAGQVVETIDKPPVPNVFKASTVGITNCELNEHILGWESGSLKDIGCAQHVNYFPDIVERGVKMPNKAKLAKAYGTIQTALLNASPLTEDLF